MLINNTDILKYDSWIDWFNPLINRIFMGPSLRFRKGFLKED